MSTIVNEIVLEDGQENPASLFVDENGKIKFKDRDSISYFMSTLAAQGGVAKLIDAAHGQPSDTLPPEVVVYIDLDDMQLYKRTESGWGVGFELRGEQGIQGPRGSKIFQGPSNPNVVSINDAEIGDIYIETGLTLTSRRMIWTKVSDIVGELKWQHAGLSFGRDGEDGTNGQQGERGRSVYEGAPDPNTLLPSSPNLPEGFFDAKNDDLYIETDSHLIWKKTDAGWVQRGATFRGRDGSPGPRVNGLFQGADAPDSPQMRSGLSEAIIGDIYIETDSHRIWKKTYEHDYSVDTSNKWIVCGDSYKSPRAARVFQGTNSSGPNTWLENETKPDGLDDSQDEDLYIDTKKHTIWKKSGGEWLQVGNSYKSPGIISGFMDPNKFDYPTAGTAFGLFGSQYDGDLIEFSKDYFSVKEANLEDSYIDTKNHVIYVKKHLTSSNTPGNIYKAWESRGLSFRGQDAYTAYLTDELVSVPAGTTGIVTQASLQNITGEFVVMKGTTKLASPIISFGYVDSDNSFVSNSTSLSVDGVKIQINNQGIYEIQADDSNWLTTSNSVSFRLAAKIQDGVAQDNSDDTIIERAFKVVKNKTGDFLILRSSSQLFKVTSYGNIEDDQEIKLTANVKGITLPAVIDWKVYKIKSDGVSYRLLADDYSDQTYFSMSDIETDGSGAPKYAGDADAVTIDTAQFSSIINATTSDDPDIGRGAKIVASHGSSVVDEMSILTVDDGVPGKSVKLTASTYYITYDSEGNSPSPSDQILLKARAYNHDPTVDTTYKFYLGQDPTRTMLSSNETGEFNINASGYPTFSTFSSGPKTYTVETFEGTSTEIIASDSITIAGVKSGTDAITIIVSNPSHSFPTDGSGVIASSNYASGETEIYVLEGGTQLTAVTGNSFTGNGQFRIVARPPTGIAYSSNSGVVVAGSNNKRLKFTPQTTSNLTTDVAKTSFDIYIKSLAGTERSVITQEQTFTKSKAGNDSKLLTLSADKLNFNKTADGTYTPSNQKINFNVAVQGFSDLVLNSTTDSSWKIFKIGGTSAETQLTPSWSGLNSSYLSITVGTGYLKATMSDTQFKSILGIDGYAAKVSFILNDVDSGKTYEGSITISCLVDGTQQKIYIAGLTNLGTDVDTSLYYWNPYYNNTNTSTSLNGTSKLEKIYTTCAGVDNGYPNLTGHYSTNKDHWLIGGGRVLDFSDEKIHYGNFITKTVENSSNKILKSTTFQVKEAGKYKITVTATFRFATRINYTAAPSFYFSVLRAAATSQKFYVLKESSCVFGSTTLQIPTADNDVPKTFYYEWDNDSVEEKWSYSLLRNTNLSTSGDELESAHLWPLTGDDSYQFKLRNSSGVNITNIANAPGYVFATDLDFQYTDPDDLISVTKSITFDTTCNLSANDYLRFKARCIGTNVSENLVCWRWKTESLIPTNPKTYNYKYQITRNPQFNIVADASSTDDINDGDTVITIEKIS